MTDEDLVEADRLEEDGRWEEAAVLRLDTVGGTTAYLGDAVAYEVHGAEVRALPGILRVELRVPPARRLGYWVWKRAGGKARGAGWGFHSAPDVGVYRPAERVPPEVRRAVDEAVRQALERRCGGSR